MGDVQLDDGSLGEAAALLIEAATIMRTDRALPMLEADSSTGIGEIVGGFMRTADIACEAVSDAAGAEAAAVIGLMSASIEAEAQLVVALGPGF